MSRRLPAIWAIGFLLLTLLAAPPAGAQDADQDSFGEANSLIRDGEVLEGIAILDSLFQQEPTSYRYYAGLKDALEDRGEFARAAEAAEMYLDATERTPAGVAEMARLHHEAGSVEKAREVWQEAVDLQPDDITAYQVVFRSMSDAQRYEFAVEIIRQARERLDQPRAFQHQLPYLLAIAGQYEESAEEYARTIHADPDRLAFIKRRIAPFLERDGAMQPTLAGASRVVREYSRDAVLRQFMAWLYVQDEQFDKALDATRAADQLGRRDGTLLIEFAEDALEVGAFSSGISALDQLLDTHPRAPFIADVRLLSGEAHYQAGSRAAYDEDAMDHFAAAIDHFSEFLQRHPEHAEYARILHLMGDIHLEHLGSLDAARQTFERVLIEMDDTSILREAQFSLARLYLLQDDLDEAERYLTEIHEAADVDLARRAALERAHIALLRGNNTSALRLATEAAHDPRAEYARDAVRLRVLLVENRQAPDSTALQQFATAELKHRQEKREESLRIANQLIERYPSYPLADDARLLRAVLLEEMGRTSAAREAFAAMVSESPSSPLADQGLFRAAVLSEATDADAAQQLYLQLIRDYPGSLHAPEARDRLRALRSTD